MTVAYLSYTRTGLNWTTRFPTIAADVARLPSGKRRKSPSYASCRKLNRTACRHRESADWPCTLRDCRSSAGEHRPVLPKRGVLKIGFECSIIYRLLLLIGAPSLRIETLSQSVRSSIQLAEPEPIRLSWPRSERCRTKGNTVELPSILQGESLTRLVQGAAAGAVATMVVGFYWGGWSLSSTANKMAKERSDDPKVREAGGRLKPFLKTEILGTMANIGVTSIAEIGPEYVVPSYPPRVAPWPVSIDPKPEPSYVASGEGQRNGSARTTA